MSSEKKSNTFLEFEKNNDRMLRKWLIAGFWIVLIIFILSQKLPEKAKSGCELICGQAGLKLEGFEATSLFSVKCTCGDGVKSDDQYTWP
jgi:hypothetical protein